MASQVTNYFKLLFPSSIPWSHHDIQFLNSGNFFKVPEAHYFKMDYLDSQFLTSSPWNFTLHIYSQHIAKTNRHNGIQSGSSPAFNQNRYAISFCHNNQNLNRFIVHASNKPPWSTPSSFFFAINFLQK